MSLRATYHPSCHRASPHGSQRALGQRSPCPGIREGPASVGSHQSLGRTHCHQPGFPFCQNSNRHRTQTSHVIQARTAHLAPNLRPSGRPPGAPRCRFGRARLQNHGVAAPPRSISLRFHKSPLFRSVAASPTLHQRRRHTETLGRCDNRCHCVS